MAEAGNPTPALPDDPEQVAAVLREEFGEDAEAMQELINQVNGHDPLTGAAFGAEPEGGEETAASEQPAVEAQTPAVEAQTPEPEEGAQAAPEAGDDGGQEPAAEPSGEPETVVATADGQHTIPFSVLQATRERANLLTAEVQRLQAQITASQEAPAPPPPDREAEKAEIEASIKTVREEYGEEAAKPYEILQKRLDALAAAEDRLQRLEAQRTQADTAAQEAAAAEEQRRTQADVDAIPTLATWQADAAAAAAGDGSKSAAMWEMAVEQEALLSRNPTWQDRPQVERFREVVRILGGDVPGSGAPSPSQKPGGQDPTPEQRAAVEQTARDAAGAAVVSASDLPAGASVQTDGQQWESMSAMEIVDAFTRMTPAQQEAVLARTA